MKLRLAVAFGAVLTIVAIGLSQSRAQRGPVFTKDGNLVLPTGFREWVFIGGPITPNGLNNGNALFPEFHNVYVEPEDFRYYQQHGSFPDGTVLAKELVLTQPGKYPDGSVDSASGRGYFPSSLHGLDVMVKDSKRFGDTHDWGFFSFGHTQTKTFEPKTITVKTGDTVVWPPGSALSANGQRKVRWGMCVLPHRGRR